MKVITAGEKRRPDLILESLLIIFARADIVSSCAFTE
jgi:hypothetical protein